LGLVGFGRVAMAVALRAKVFGFKVIFFDPFVKDGTEKSYGVARVYSLDTLLAQSDCVSLHCGLNEPNKEVLNAISIQKMRPSTVTPSFRSASIISTASV